jgi:hypothetical protein
MVLSRSMYLAVYRCDNGVVRVPWHTSVFVDPDAKSSEVPLHVGADANDTAAVLYAREGSPFELYRLCLDDGITVPGYYLGAGGVVTWAVSIILRDGRHRVRQIRLPFAATSCAGFQKTEI